MQELSAHFISLFTLHVDRTIYLDNKNAMKYRHTRTTSNVQHQGNIRQFVT